MIWDKRAIFGIQQYSKNNKTKFNVSSQIWQVFYPPHFKKSTNLETYDHGKANVFDESVKPEEFSRENPQIPTGKTLYLKRNEHSRRTIAGDSITWNTKSLRRLMEEAWRQPQIIED